MRSSFYVFLGAIIAVILIGCNNFDDSFVIVNPSSLYFHCNSSSQTVVITSSGDWEISYLPEWCNVSSTKGESGKEVSITVHENKEIERSGEMLIICGNSSATISITQFAEIKTNYIDFKFNDNGTSYSYNEDNGLLTLRYKDKKMPQISVGQATVLPYEHNFNIRLIESVSVSDSGEVTLYTSQGDMSDLFYDIKFALSINETGNVKSSDRLQVYSPTSIGFINDNGEYVEIPYDIISKGYSFEAQQNLCAIHKDWNGEIILEDNTGKLFWEKCSIDATLDGYFLFEFEKGVKEFYCSINGNLLMDFLMHYNYIKEFSKTHDKIIAKDIISPKVITFTVGGVPIPLYINMDLGNSLSFSIDGKIDASAGITMTGDMKTEISWSKEKGGDIKTEFSKNYDIHYPSLEISASAEAKVSYYPHISVLFYGIGGPWIQPRPYLKEDISVGAGISLENDVYMGWQAETTAGVDIKAGLGLIFINKTLVNWESKLKPVCEGIIFDAPNRVSITHPQADTTVALNQSINVRCLTESYSPVTNSYYECYPVIVKATDDFGYMRYNVSKAQDGIVSFDWTPFTTDNIDDVKHLGNSNKLHISIENPNGDIISEDYLNVKLDEEGNEEDNEEDDEEDDDKDKDKEENDGEKDNEGDQDGKEESKRITYQGEPVDLGLSVKWGTCNFGASNKEEYGQYYAWGELDPKITYNTSTYLYKDIDIHLYLGNEISGTIYDAVAQRYGHGWRMPTYYEVNEVLQKCTITESSVKGVKGIILTGPNGNEIFIPAAGYMLNDYCINDDMIIATWSGTFDCYKSPDGTRNPCAYALFSTTIPLSSSCVMGLPIRPVLD